VFLGPACRRSWWSGHQLAASRAARGQEGWFTPRAGHEVRRVTMRRAMAESVPPAPMHSSGRRRASSRATPASEARTRDRIASRTSRGIGSS
jgi:hypothetical protein